MLSPTRLIFPFSGCHRIHFCQHGSMDALGHYSNIQCFLGNQAVSSCNRTSWLVFFKVTYCRRFMLSFSYTERVTFWNFKSRFPFTVAVLFCEGAFVPILHIGSLCPGTKKQMLHVWFEKRQFPCNVNITAQPIRWWRQSFQRLNQGILLIWEPLNAVDLAPLFSIVLDHGGAT